MSENTVIQLIMADRTRQRMEKAQCAPRNLTERLLDAIAGAAAALLTAVIIIIGAIFLLAASLCNRNASEQ
jgi:hypothetical protein